MTRASVETAPLRRAIEDVPDPELPAVTIGMLGMVHHLAVTGGQVVVELLPTFSGCPATDMIARDVADAVEAVDGVEQVLVRFVYDPPWTPDRIDAAGRQRLREFGIAPPGGPLPAAVRPQGRRTLPLASLPPAARPCPYCGSQDTVLDSAFGPTPCRDLRYCETCRQPFEAFQSA